MLRLCDGQAQPWRWRIGEGKYLTMRPLSLATFAMAEENGCGLDRLLSSDGEEQATAWIQLYALLSDQTGTEAAQQLVSGEVFKAFADKVQSSLVSPEEQKEKAERPALRHRKAKDPRELISGTSGRTMKIEKEASTSTEEEDNSTTSTDWMLLFELSRYAKIPISDIYQMTFRGLTELSKYCKENPPIPTSPFGGEVL